MKIIAITYLFGLIFWNTCCAETKNPLIIREEKSDASKRIWEGKIFTSKNEIKILLTHTTDSKEPAYVLTGILHNAGIIENDSGIGLKMELIAPIGLNHIQIVWPKKKGSNLVTANQMLRLKFSPEKKGMIQRISYVELHIKEVDMPMVYGRVRPRKTLIHCTVGGQ